MWILSLCCAGGVYLYLLTVIPWHSIAIDDARYKQAYNVICNLRESLSLWLEPYCCPRGQPAAGAASTRHLVGAGAAYTFGSLLVNLSIHRRVYSTGSLYDLPSIAALLWLGTAGVVAYSSRSETSSGKGQGDGGEIVRKRAAQRSRLGVALGANGIAFASPPRHLVCENSQAPMAGANSEFLLRSPPYCL